MGFYGKRHTVVWGRQMAVNGGEPDLLHSKGVRKCGLWTAVNVGYFPKEDNESFETVLCSRHL